LAIELDDKSHEREDRMERDIEVERIFREAGMPLLRIENHGNFDAVKIAEQIKNAIK
jgi:very-short-patch-repair endonuclease